jgi:hypothetical protein
MRLVNYINKRDDPDIFSKFGYVPYGNLGVHIAVSPNLGSPFLWAYYMSSGAASFFCSDYAVVSADSLEALVKKVDAKLAESSYLLHGVPVHDGTTFAQALVVWDRDLSVLRSKQLLGTLATLAVDQE